MIKDIFCLLGLTILFIIGGIVELFRPTSFEDDWLEINCYSNENNGQGRLKNE